MPVPLVGVDQNVRIVDSSGVAFGTLANPLNAQITGAGSGGTSAVDAAAWTTAVSAFTPGGGVFNDSAAALASGTQGTLRMTPNRAQHVSLRTQAGAEIIPASFPVDAAAWTTAVSTFDPVGGVFNDSAAALTSGQQGTLRLTNNRAAHANLRTAAGVEIGTSAAPFFVQGAQATGAALTTNPFVVAGQFAGNAKLLALDTNGVPTVNQGGTGSGGAGAWFAQGPDAAGAAIVGRPFGMGISDGVNAQFAKQTTSATGTTGVGLLGTGPLLWDGVGTTNFIKQMGDGSGRAMMVGAAAAGAAIAGNPVLIGGSDATNARALLVSTAGRASIDVNLPGAGPYPSIGFAPAAPTCTFTRGANTTAYTIGDEVGTSGTAPTTISVARANGLGGIIQGACAVYSNYPATVPSLLLVIFSATVTLAGDNAQFALSDADAAKVVAVIPLSSAQALNYSAGAAVSTGALFLSGAPSRPAPHFVCGGSEVTLYCCLVTLNAFTPIANSETISVAVDVEQN